MIMLTRLLQATFLVSSIVVHPFAVAADEAKAMLVPHELTLGRLEEPLSALR